MAKIKFEKSEIKSKKKFKNIQNRYKVNIKISNTLKLISKKKVTEKQQQSKRKENNGKTKLNQKRN